MTKEPLVMLPGLMCDEAVWIHQRRGLAALADTYVPQYHDVDTITAMAAKVLAEAPFEDFSLAGHSMGGRVALEIMRLAPQRVRRLALLDTGYEALDPGAPGQDEQARRLALLGYARQHGMREMGKSIWAPGMVHPNHLQSPLFEEILDMIARRSPDEFEAQIKALLGRPDATPVLQSLACPTFIICGRQDDWSPLSRHEVMCSLVPAPVASLHVIEDSGHMSTMEQPDAVTAVLTQWLSRSRVG